MGEQRGSAQAMDLSDEETEDEMEQATLETPEPDSEDNGGFESMKVSPQRSHEEYQEAASNGLKQEPESSKALPPVRQLPFNTQAKAQPQLSQVQQPAEDDEETEDEL